MKKMLGIFIVGGGLIFLLGAAGAHWGSGSETGRWGWHGHGMGSAGRGVPYGHRTAPAQITEERAKELAQAYADEYLPGFKVERVLPFAARHHTMYTAEAKNEAGELRAFHINPFGNVMPMGGSFGPWRHGS